MTILDILRGSRAASTSPRDRRVLGRRSAKLASERRERRVLLVAHLRGWLTARLFGWRQHWPSLPAALSLRADGPA